MKNTIKSLGLIIATGLLTVNAFAGNEDRSGQAGAPELLLNPWARTSGWGGVNIAGVRGLEGQFLNVAGTAFTKKTEILFAHTNYLQGTGINVNSFGFSQKVGASGVLALGVMAMNFGDIQVTTVNMPEGGLGTFSINFLNVGLSYAKGFTDHIYGGLCVRGVNEQIPDAKAAALALDAGIQYLSGKNNRTKFGISLKNVGPKMQYKGDGLAGKVVNSNNQSSYNLSQQSESFEMPSQLNIGGSYDIFLDGVDSVYSHKITLAAAFIANSFTKDELRMGLEYAFKSYFMLRGGYVYEKGIGTDDDAKDAFRTTVNKGLSAGFTFEIPLNREKGSSFGLDYSYRVTKPFNGTHSFGVRMSL